MQRSSAITASSSYCSRYESIAIPCDGGAAARVFQDFAQILIVSLGAVAPIDRVLREFRAHALLDAPFEKCLSHHRVPVDCGRFGTRRPQDL